MITVIQLSPPAGLSEVALINAFELLPLSLCIHTELRVPVKELFFAHELRKKMLEREYETLFKLFLKSMQILPDHVRTSLAWELRGGDTIVYSDV